MTASGWTRRAAALVALLGVVGAVAPAAAQELKYPVGMLGKFTPDGMLLQKVLPGKPAEKAGLQNGDLVLKVDGRLITNQSDFVTLVNSSGGQLMLVVRKGSTGRIARIGLDLAGNGKLGPVPYFLGVIGSFGPNGMLIGQVIPGTPAAKAALAKGDLIARVNGFPVATQADFFTVLYNSGGNVTLQVKKSSGRLVKQDVSLTTYELGVLGDFNRSGMVIGVVAPDTPAAYMGLQKGDVIQRIDNQPVRTQKEFDRLINNSGGSVTLQVQRVGQQPVRVEVELMNNQLCAWCETVNDGLRILAVVPGGPADALGLMRGDLLLKIDDQRLTSHADLIRSLRGSRGLITLTYRSGQTGRIRKIDVDLAR